MNILTGRQFHLPEQGLQLSKDVDHKDLDQTIPQLIYEGAGLHHLKQIIHPTAATQATMISVQHARATTEVSREKSIMKHECHMDTQQCNST